MSGDKKWRARARVQITVELFVGDAWGEDCSFAQIKKQAIESAEGALMRGLVLNCLQSGRDSKTDATIISEPTVTAIWSEDA